MIIKDIEKKEIFGLKLVNVTPIMMFFIPYDNKRYNKDNNNPHFLISWTDEHVNRDLIFGGSKK